MNPVQSYDGLTFGSGRSSMMYAGNLNKSSSHANIIPADRFGPSKSTNDISTSIMTSASVATIPTKVVALTDQAQK